MLSAGLSRPFCRRMEALLAEARELATMRDVLLPNRISGGCE